MLQQQYRLSRSTGVLVTSVDTQGPGAGSGLRQGDIMSLTIDCDGSQLALSLTLVERSGSTS